MATWLFQASWDRTLKVWDLATGAEVATLRGHADSVTGVAMFAAGKRAISASWDRTLKVWDLGASTQTRADIGHGAEGSAVAVHGDSTRVISASGITH